MQDNNTLTGFYAQITFGAAKPEVTYTVERALVDASGNPGTYAQVPVYKNTGDTTALGTAGLKADVLGNLPNPIVFDKVSTTTAVKYQYRIKATKGEKTQTREISGIVSFNPHSYAPYVLSISINAASGTDTKTYAVTPSLYNNFKGILQAGDKLVIYYVKGSYGNGNLYQTGPYTLGVEFTKAELEAATVASKNLVIPKADGDTYAYVQAYLESADGTRENISGINSGGGVSSTSSYNPGSGSIYYAVLDY
jgi:hypothetical protein